MTQNAEKEEYRQKGMKEGEKIGRQKGKIEAKLEILTQLLDSKYQNKNLTWLKLCDEEQLNSVMELFMKDMSHDDFFDYIKKNIFVL